MVYLTSVKECKAIVLCNGQKQICSFPPKLNNFRIPTMKEALMIWKGEAK